ncbi:unnamed protein product [Cylicocyclus nassatus]|uniref:SURP motif domain-containing protein n=1 Tax=Cylicocyclus nassatus TaxID=53992 RepID=A0AA36M2S6_CYLNA|nr:unnamed protein product [Cylicocyclus nassatus]
MVEFIASIRMTVEDETLRPVSAPITTIASLPQRGCFKGLLLLSTVVLYPFPSEIHLNYHSRLHFWNSRILSSYQAVTTPNMTADEDLLVFGYASRIYPQDDRAEYIAEERHLIESPYDPAIRLDRYDCRLLLPVGCDVFASSCAEESESCPTEDMEEEMCDEERYRDLNSSVEQKIKEEEEARPKKAEIAFDYGTSGASGNGDAGAAAEDSDSETEPFEPPAGIKLPMGLALPENQKQNHIIERTALFVVTKGPQMEIVIKAKQRNNTEQFGFLEFDNVLHPYYKYLSKLIREKKYTPNFSKRTKDSKDQTSEPSTSETNGAKKSNALTALAEESNSDSDSDYELHPSLLSSYRKRSRSPDVMDTADNAAGPRRRPASPSPPPLTVHRSDYDMSKSNDIYASLYKSLKMVSTEKEVAEKRKQEQQEIEEQIAASAPPPPDEEYRAWWLSFYGTPCPYSCPQPMVPPPPDLQPVIASYAEFVARHGADAELELRDRVDLQLHFMHPNSHHFSYYQHLVRMCQWELHQKMMEESSAYEQAAGDVDPDGENADGADAPTVPPNALSIAEATAQALNRRQRRRLQDALRVPVAQPVGIVDPVASLGDGSLPKVSSSPALLSSVSHPSLQVEGVDASVTNNDTFTAPKSFPVSFSLAPVVSSKDEIPGAAPSMAVMEGPGSPALVDPRTLSPLSVPSMQPTTSNVGLILPPPVPPNIPSNTQLDRKEKARIFMERLLNEKRVKKLKEQEEARIRELEAQKAEIERQLAEEETKRKKTSLEMVDKLINRRIGALLGTATETKKVEEKQKLKIPARLSDDEAQADRDDMRKKRKKEKSKKHKHKKSRSRSRDRSRDRERERRRRRRSSDSSSDERDSSKKRRKERR